MSADPEDRRCTLATMAATRVGIVRSTFHWSLIEPEPRKFDLSYYDAYVGQLSRYRIRVLPILIGSPRFYSSAPNARFPDRAQPRSNRDFARFARVLALRYGPRGSFWRANPAVPRLPIRAWQVWNEPNLRIFWSPRPRPRAYVRMLKAVAQSVRRVDRRAEIVAGGLPESQFGMSVDAYVRGIYRAGGARWFDALAVHPYSRTAAQALNKVRRLRRLMDRSRDRRARIWVTEFGWPSGGPRHRFRVGRRGQARRVAHVLRGLWRQRHRLRIRGANHVMWRDPPRYRSDTWGLHLGLYTRQAKPKPAAKAFKAAARKMR